MSHKSMEKFEKYNLLRLEKIGDIQNILINEDSNDEINNLILDCTILSEIELEEHFSILEKFSLTLITNEKTFIVLHPSFPTDKWDEVIVIPTLHEAKEYVFMEELTRGF